MIDVKKLSENLPDFRSGLSDCLVLLQHKQEMFLLQRQFEQAADIGRIIDKLRSVLDRLKEVQSNLSNTKTE